MGAINHKEFKDIRRTYNERTVSVGDNLWNFRRLQQKKLEQLGKVQILTPDSEGAFVAVLLSLYAPNKLWCPITAKYHPKINITAAHIVPAKISIETMEYIFGGGKGLRLFSPDNCLLLLEAIERALDKANIAIVPFDTTQPITRWKVVLTNYEAKHQNYDADHTLGSLDQKELVFLSDHRPASRFLYFNFITTLLRCRANKTPGWAEVWTKFQTENHGRHLDIVPLLK
ncbi:MAG: hypothetical protein M1829_000201 [Trizodia sp. TS-e1964]|nr:MAG: hypothetical protein M1829_000201 [Trizodia sp. TS-e1964]